MRATARISNVSFDTIAKLLLDAGTAFQVNHEEYVRDVKVRRVQVDEIWSFCYA